jgi:SAM-dependent methyltransferase
MSEPTSTSSPLPMRPAGLAGRLFGVVMERMNARAYSRALDRLAPVAGEHFLEIGFGTGRFVERLLAAAPDVRVAGVDPTGTMLDVALHRRGVRAAGGRVDLRLGGDAPLPWPDASFDGVAALHSFQFWPDPTHSLREIARVLRPGGRLVLVLRAHDRQPPDWLPNPLSRSGRELDAAAELLRAEGYADVEERDPAGSSRILFARRAR